jgi:hypothetical protein
MRRRNHILWGLATAILLVICAATFLSKTVIWDGHFPLQVTLINDSGRVISEVATAVLQRKEFAKHVGTPSFEREVQLQPVEWAEGQSFVVDVRNSGRSRMSWKYDYHQFALLVLRIRFSDDGVEFVSYEIPDGRNGSVAVTIELKPKAEKK